MALTPTRLAWNNLLTASGVTWTASATATGYKVTNLANRARWKKWRSTTTTGDQWVKCDTGSSQSMQCHLLASWRAHGSGGTVKAQANATDSWGSPTVDQTLTLPSPNPTGVIGIFLGAASSLRWVRFYFTNVGAASDYVEIGAAFAGGFLEPTASIAPGVGLLRHDPALIAASGDGQESADAHTKYFEVGGLFRLQSDTNADSFITMAETVGSSLPLFFALDPDSANRIYYGRFRDALQLQHDPDSALLWRVPFSLVEVR